MTDDEYLWGLGAWITAVRALDAAAPARPVGAAEPFPDAPMATLVLYIHRGAHGAFALLRDLYRARPSLRDTAG